MIMQFNFRNKTLIPSVKLCGYILLADPVCICNGWNRCGLHNKEQVEIVVREWLQIQEPDIYRCGAFGGGFVFINCDSSLEQTKVHLTL